MTPPARAPAEALIGTGPVQGLTVRQPRASAIAPLGKTIENRAKITTYTGWLLIHAAKRVDPDGCATPRATCPTSASAAPCSHSPA
ncbi:hypothetical protein GCM10027160_35110 [Streptomyces calidiresistens]|uniref:Uncharacterized protein n=1 Tax=Streptomyces calidiresistens TaxID=1485586 RepID=A0A7W3T7T2_9ACTN|nr:hypothetical protein [Streptomyces calidiresistens]MBB0232529.1 hypothetical protein [Streptomyces calidiresistens]